MYQVWMDDRLYGIWNDKIMAEDVLDFLSYKYPNSKLEIKVYK